MVSACTSMRIRQGELCDRAYLEELQRRASLANPGDTPHLLEQPEFIALPEWQLSSGRVMVAEYASVMLGFAVLLAPLEGSAELTGVFVEPGCWRKGIGLRLVQACMSLARSEAARRMSVVVNPHAADFYRACGFAPTGTTRTQFGPAFLMSLPL